MKKRDDEQGWVGGNRLQLLENGEQFFPAVFAAIEAAEREVLIETFILFEDKVGLALHAVLLAAARRGIRVELTVDGFGSPELSEAFVCGLTEAGVRLHVFDPPPRLLSRRLRPFRRLHRKLVVVDGRIGFIGGINFSADHLSDYGPEAKQDYALRAEGPVVAQLHRAAQRLIAPAQTPTPLPPPPIGQAEALLATRDNHRHRDDIERFYRRALHAARHEVIIANAYFFPGYRLLKSLQRAARRGVRVHLILQGRPDIPWATWAARMVYHRLIRAGVCIHEYRERPLHGKVALVDEEWATVGSSNLDPLSLALNLEANLMVRDRAFNAALRARLLPLMREHCRRVELEQTPARRWWWPLGVGALAFHVLRHFPRWAARLPARAQGRRELGAGARTEQPAQAWQWRAGEQAPGPAGR
ncbi:cardiolipin synthase ClsB [Roseateles sp. DAIF2]|uniref:cardiolipin synthase ClsB n=1 Tax=Roseateles sp. DAIF2 TaxID=2714952 RepID=UPI0018A308CA|nr:cardiolipin synthase ClsB [Roseateles sp. DAIF2]QPF72581.1 cardiolipin synthase ClsB [Roseateles sp. DAIF2]